MFSTRAPKALLDDTMLPFGRVLGTLGEKLGCPLGELFRGYYFLPLMGSYDKITVTIPFF